MAGRHVAQTPAHFARVSHVQKSGHFAQLQPHELSTTVQRKPTAMILSSVKGGISTVRAQITSNFSSMPLEPSPETRHGS
eukprot:3337847-Pleurochrysis_carterae.AAC.1